MLARGAERDRYHAASVAATVAASVGAAALSGLLAGCSAYAYSDDPLPYKGAPAPVSRATFDVVPRGKPDVLVLLAMSGGGSRAAYFGGSVMLELQSVFPELDVLKEVDAISSVSGGSLPAAYYCVSRDPGDPKDRAVSGRVWEPEEVRELMSRNYILRLFGNFFWPTNIVLYYSTAFDRADIMSQTFADNMFDRKMGGRDLLLGELNAERPCLILNSTDATQNRVGKTLPDGTVQPAEQHYGSVFTFTTEDFTNKLGADINQYSVARAVMATACFPSVFPYMTLRDWRELRGPEERYVHVFDGGNSDNLGLVSFERLLHDVKEKWPEARRPKSILVISIDAYTQPRGVDRDKADPRTFTDYIVDHNFLDAVDALLGRNRYEVLKRFVKDEAEQEDLRNQQIEDAPVQQLAPGEPDVAQQIKDAVQREPEKTPPPAPAPPLAPEPLDELRAGWEPRDLPELTFWHIQFRDVADKDVRARVNKIPTNFTLPDDQAAADLDAAAHDLVHNAKALPRVRRALRLP